MKNQNKSEVEVKKREESLDMINLINEVTDTIREHYGWSAQESGNDTDNPAGQVEYKDDVPGIKGTAFQVKMNKELCSSATLPLPDFCVKVPDGESIVIHSTKVVKGVVENFLRMDEADANTPYEKVNFGQLMERYEKYMSPEQRAELWVNALHDNPDDKELRKAWKEWAFPKSAKKEKLNDALSNYCLKPLYVVGDYVIVGKEVAKITVVSTTIFGTWYQCVYKNDDDWSKEVWVERKATEQEIINHLSPYKTHQYITTGFNNRVQQITDIKLNDKNEVIYEFDNSGKYLVESVINREARFSERTHYNKSLEFSVGDLVKSEIKEDDGCVFMVDAVDEGVGELTTHESPAGHVAVFKVRGVRKLTKGETLQYQYGLKKGDTIICWNKGWSNEKHVCHFVDFSDCGTHIGVQVGTLKVYKTFDIFCKVDMNFDKEKIEL